MQIYTEDFLCQLKGEGDGQQQKKCGLLSMLYPLLNVEKEEWRMCLSRWLKWEWTFHPGWTWVPSSPPASTRFKARTLFFYFLFRYTAEQAFTFLSPDLIISQNFYICSFCDLCSYFTDPNQNRPLGHREEKGVKHRSSSLHYPFFRKVWSVL